MGAEGNPSSTICLRSSAPRTLQRPQRFGMLVLYDSMLPTAACKLDVDTASNSIAAAVRQVLAIFPSSCHRDIVMMRRMRRIARGAEQGREHLGTTTDEYIGVETSFQVRGYTARVYTQAFFSVCTFIPGSLFRQPPYYRFRYAFLFIPSSGRYSTYSFGKSESRNQ